MTTTTPRPDDITITHYTVDSKPVSMPFRCRVGAVLALLRDAVGTLLYYGRLVGHDSHRTCAVLAHLLHRAGRGLLFLVQLPFRLVITVSRIIRFAIKTLLGLLLLSIILMVLMALVHSVFGDTLHYSFPPHVPRFPS